jgi:hypothetical protein
MQTELNATFYPSVLPVISCSQQEFLNTEPMLFAASSGLVKVFSYFSGDGHIHNRKCHSDHIHEEQSRKDEGKR